MNVIMIRDELKMRISVDIVQWPPGLLNSLDDCHSCEARWKDHIDLRSSIGQWLKSLIFYWSGLMTQTPCDGCH